jgi:hypothetical protein
MAFARPCLGPLTAWVAPGNYTAIVRGKNDTRVGLLESYNLP